MQVVTVTTRHLPPVYLANATIFGLISWTTISDKERVAAAPSSNVPTYANNNQYPTATGGAYGYPQPAPLINGYVRPQTYNNFGGGAAGFGSSSNTFASGFQGNPNAGPLITINGQPMGAGQSYNLGSGQSPLTQTQNFGQTSNYGGQAPYYNNNVNQPQYPSSAYFPSNRLASPSLPSNQLGSEKVPNGYNFDYSAVPLAAYKAEIEKQARAHPLLMYSATTCSFCKKAKTQLRSMGIQFAFFDWDAHRNQRGPEMFNALSQFYGNGQLKTVPQILVCGRLIGGYDALMSKINGGTLRSELAACPAQP